MTETTQLAGAAAPMPAGAAAPARPAEQAEPAAGRVSLLRRLLASRVAQLALAMIVVQLGVRAWVSASSDLFWDDLILAGQATMNPLLSTDALLQDHDGHLMPGGFLVSGLLAQLAPLQWWPLGVTLVLLQALASLAVWRLLRVLLGDRPVLLVPLGIYLFSPLTLPTYSWWAAAINSLPLQAALAWFCADAVLLLRTGRRRYAVTGVLALLLSLAFFEKSVVIPAVAFAVVAIVLRHDGEQAPLVTAFRRCLPLWIGSGLVLGGWFAVYSATRPTGPDLDGSGSVATAVDMVRLGVLEAFLPSAIGGPLGWTAGDESAAPPVLLVVLGVVVLAAAVVWTSWRRRSGTLAWWLLGAYVGASVLALVVGRLTASVPADWALNLRYYADSAVVLALVVALVARAPARTDVPAEPLLPSRVQRGAALVAVAVFLVLSGWSTATYVRAFQDDLPREYLATARAALLAEGEVAMLDQAVPERVIWSVAYPDNQASVVFAPLDQGPRFGDWATDLRRLDDDGNVVDVRLVEKLAALEGPVPGCGHSVSGDATTELPLQGELFPWGWVVQLNYLASQDGVVEVALQSGAPTRVPVEGGAGTVYVQLDGGGEHVEVTSRTEGLGVCVSSALVGELPPQR